MSAHSAAAVCKPQAATPRHQRSRASDTAFWQEWHSHWADRIRGGE
ncbi:hypothetical protein [Paenibacillus sp. UMB7766-LJ446]|nr:hypothetical protein [Paenibacillus sp. UMB7766-LJ446]